MIVVGEISDELLRFRFDACPLSSDAPVSVSLLRGRKVALYLDDTFTWMNLRTRGRY